MADRGDHLHEVLDGYAKFLQDKNLALNKHQPYLVRWVREFLLFARAHVGYSFEQTLGLFLADVGGDKRPYRYVACMLQLFESTIMIYRVCGRILRERPDTPVWTIHDCVMTTEPHRDYVRQVIIEEFATVGLQPAIKQECV